MPAAPTEMSPIKVLVTRPEPDAGRWVADLRRLGFDAWALPLIVIAPVPDRTALHHAWRTVPRSRAIMCVSAAAATHFLMARPADVALDSAVLPHFWAPGPGTARALLAGGVPADRIQSPPENAEQFDSEALWSVVGRDVAPGDQILIVRGEDAQRHDSANPNDSSHSSASANPGHGRDWMSKTLATRGASVQFVVAYRREPPQWSAAEKTAALRATGRAIWLFSNSDAIATLVDLMGTQPWVPAAALCTHRRIAEAAHSAGFSSVGESRPTIESIAASLRELAATAHST
jgi:uroporphyrinogen-III synthase